MDGTFLDLSFVLCETLHSITSSLLESLINSPAEAMLVGTGNNTNPNNIACDAYVVYYIRILVCP